MLWFIGVDEGVIIKLNVKIADEGNIEAYIFTSIPVLLFCPLFITCFILYTFLLSALVSWVSEKINLLKTGTSSNRNCDFLLP